MNGENIIRGRDLSLDAIAGFFIVLMMFRHFNILTKSPYTFGHLFMFNICWFFFKAGMFHRPTNFNKNKIVRWIKGLIVPYLIFAGLGILCELFSSLILGDESWGIIRGGIAQMFHQAAPWWNIPIWFLLSLFLIKIITSHYKGGIGGTLCYILIGLTVAYLHHLFFNPVDFNYIGNTALGVVFYVMGYQSKVIKLNVLHYITLEILFVALLFISPAAIDLFGNSTLYGNYFQAITAAIIGMFLINKLFSIFRILQIKPLIFIGQNAMVFMLFHVPIAMIIRTSLIHHPIVSYDIANWIIAVISIALCIPLVYLFDRNKKYKWIIGG